MANTESNEAAVTKIIDISSALQKNKKSSARSDKSIALSIDYKKPVATIFCVQNYEQGVLTGVCFYNSQAKAKYIADLGNEKYAELKVQMEMKVISYPVF